MDLVLTLQVDLSECRLPLAADVNLPSIANKTGDFTGADLGALLADSQLAAVRALLASKQSEQVMVGFD